MILLDLMDVLNNLDSEHRDIAYPKLLAHLTEISYTTILEFQFEYNPQKETYGNFINRLNELIIECVTIETSMFGKILRRKYDLPPLTLRTEIEL